MGESIKKIANGTITSPKGYIASGVAAGIKKSGALDLAVIHSKSPCVFGCAFTNNSLAAAPVLYCKEICEKSSRVRSIVVNSGNANSCTGNPGQKDAALMAEYISQYLGISPQEVFVSSTGRIGVLLPMEKIKGGIKAACSNLLSNGGMDAAEAILTTDKKRKTAALGIQLNGVDITIGGIAKGAGMLYPRLEPVKPHATMLAYITTDAAIEENYFQHCLLQSLDKSFNRISIDGDTSTNDTFIALANGMAGNSVITKDSKEAICFYEAFESVATELARMMVMDGEGTTKFVELLVTGASTTEEARRCAECIANSLLCKTAWFGADPNWGRILDAAGYSGVEICPSKVALNYDSVPVVVNGVDSGISSKAEREAVLKKREFIIHLDLGIGFGQCTFWTCDLSYDYVKINADYHT